MPCRLQHFIFFLGFFSMYLIKITIQIDWTYASDTLSLYDLARTNIQAIEYQDRTSLALNIDYLGKDFDHLTTELATHVCKDCDVALTDDAKDLQDLSLTSFICSDFLSTADSNNYPSRDCPAADADYSAGPSADKAPCCINQTLVQASMAIMSWSDFSPQFLEDGFLSPGPISLEDLLNIDHAFTVGAPYFGYPDLDQWKLDVFSARAVDIPAGVAQAGLYFYTRNSIDTPGEPLVQVTRRQKS